MTSGGRRRAYNDTVGNKEIIDSSPSCEEFGIGEDFKGLVGTVNFQLEAAKLAWHFF